MDSLLSLDIEQNAKTEIRMISNMLFDDWFELICTNMHLREVLLKKSIISIDKFSKTFTIICFVTM